MIFFLGLWPSIHFEKSYPFRTVRLYSNLNERQKQIILFLQRNKGQKISREDYIQITKALPRTASRDLVDLVKRQVIKKEGKTRGAKYYLLWIFFF